MSVAYVSTKSLTPANGTGGVSSSWNISAAANPVIVIYIGCDSAVTVTAVSWSLGSGTPVQVCTTNNQTQCYGFIWVIPAPVSGTGTFTVTLSGATDYQISADLFSGAHQTNPCPSADADTDNNGAASGGPALTLTPTNVAAEDAMGATTTHTQTGDSAGWTTGTTSYEDNTTATNTLTGYRLATGSMTSAALSSGGGARLIGLATRVAAAAAAADSVVTYYRHSLGSRRPIVYDP